MSRDLIQSQFFRKMSLNIREHLTQHSLMLGVVKLKYLIEKQIKNEGTPFGAPSEREKSE